MSMCLSHKNRVLFRNAKKNEEFNRFFENYKKENKGKWQSITNGMDITEDKLFEKTYGENEDEANMYSEFQDRRKYEAFYDNFTNKPRETVIEIIIKKD